MRHYLMTTFARLSLKQLFAAIFACTILLAPVRSAARTTSIQSMRGDYEKLLARLDGSYEATAKEEHGRYAKSLDALGSALRKKGDLDGVIATKNEKKRFAAEKTIPKADSRTAAPIAKLRANSHSRVSNARIKKNLGIISITQRYLAAAEQQKKLFTRQDKIEQALEWKAEIDRVKTSGAIAAAEFVLAEEGYDASKSAVAKKPAAKQEPEFDGPRPLLLWRGFKDGASMTSVYKGKVTKHKLAGKNGSRVSRKGIECNGGRVVVESANKILSDACRKNDELTIEAKFTAANSKQYGPARIISFSLDGHNRNFTIGQSRRMLVLRLRTSRTGPNGAKPQVTLCEMDAKKEYHILVSYKPGKLVFYLDGRKVDVKSIEGDFRNWEEQQLLFGNEWKDDRIWRGAISYVAIYDKFIDPDAKEDE